jgi:hypothetical protein
MAVLLLTLTGCAPRRLDSRDLSSSLRATASLAAETAVFQNYLRSGHATATYARMHANYLAEELADERRSLDGVRVDPDLEGMLAQCRNRQEKLAGQLEQLRTALQDRRGRL